MAVELQVPAFLHMEHEIRYTRFLEIDVYMSKYAINYSRAYASGDFPKSRYWRSAMSRRALGLWEEARDWFLSTLTT